MSTPNDERPEPTFVESSTQAPPVSINIERPTLQSDAANNEAMHQNEKASDEEGTVFGEGESQYVQNDKDNMPPNQRARATSHLTYQTLETQYEAGDPLRTIHSGSRSREEVSRLDDRLAVLKIERQLSRMGSKMETSDSRTKSDEMYRSRSRRTGDREDEFDAATNPVHEKTQAYRPAEHPSTAFAKFFKQIHGSNFLIKYFAYIVPVTVILLIPLMLGALLFKNATVGGVYLMWFMIWLEIVWLTLWAGRILAKCLPVPIGLVSSLFSNNSKKWRDMGKQLELPATIFFWWLAIEISFLPTMTFHQKDHPHHYKSTWMVTMNKVLVSLFVGAVLNFVEKIIIQLIAISFHLRTYSDRIEINKFQIESLTKLYKYSRAQISLEDKDFEQPSPEPGSGALTPGVLMAEAAKTGKAAFEKFGDVAGKVAGDFTGKAVIKSTHPHQVILALLHSIHGSQVLARRLYRTFAREETETVFSDDLRHAFESEDEAEAAFSMFDKDMNGDISMEELEAVCVEIGRERKSIMASLKDLDSVVSKLDSVFMFVVFVITVLVLISLISTSAAGVLTSAGSTVLALSWLFSATAQEFLQSVIFVFVKHPFDVGDRVSVYGNTGSLMRGDDYFVKEISLLYTEFKKMEGHIVQAPNSYLNTLFILNQRRSGGLAEAVTITIKFGTTLDQIDGMRMKLLEFVQSEKREYQGKILTELRDITEVHSINLNVIFFYKSNWQNEGLRLARRNKFICALMVTMQELGIEGPNMRFPGQRESFPVYLQNVPHVSTGTGHGGHPDNPLGVIHEEPRQQDPPFVTPMAGQDDDVASSLAPQSRTRGESSMRSTTTRRRVESLSQMDRRVDFSLGMKDLASGDTAGDVYDDRDERRIPREFLEASRERSAARTSQEISRASQDNARTTSRDIPTSSSHLTRRSTDGAGRWRNASSVHRNRFFGRHHPDMSAASDEAGILEKGMADIPENPSVQFNTSPADAESRRVERLDPRTGMVSPAAWRMHSDESNLHPPPPQPPPSEMTNINAYDRHQPSHRSFGRSQTEDLEMRRFH